jgi:hypothetical protein
MPVEYQEILLDSWKKIKIKNNLILHFNYLLDKKAYYFSLNESLLENLIEQLDNLVLIKDVSYWLTLARINELTLLCTENYANNGELTLVGDLLLNPRLILVHIQGEKRPVVKKRHALLTEQFRFAAETHQGVIEWLKRETCLEIKSEALLPFLLQRLEKSGYFRKEYFESLNKRKIRIAKLTGFLSGIGSTESFDFHQWFEKAGSSDRELIKSKLCPCNRDLYFDLGRRVRDIAQGPLLSTGFQYHESAEKNGGMIYAESDPEYQWPIPASGLG